VSRAARAVTVHLAGGLGNQLFQYAFGRRLSLVNEARLFLDASDYKSDTVPDYQKGIRVCELSNFAIAGSIINDSASLWEGHRHAPRAWIIRKLAKWWRRLIILAGRTMPYYMRREIVEPEKNHFRFDARLYRRTFRGAVSVRGFWQTEKYFADIEDVLRKELVVQHGMTGRNLELAKALQDTASVCVHVRHGDNAGPIAALLGVLPRQYYVSAMQDLIQELVRPHYFVFSDDISWAKNLLPNDMRMTYVDHNRGARSHEDMRLLSLGKHHIIANSTFGWWGAWLGKKEGQIVYAPRRYYQNMDRPNPDLYPANWRLL
jgi:hypothetical protein